MSLWNWEPVRSPYLEMISLTGRGHGDILGMLNGGGDGFPDSSYSDKESRLPLCIGGATFCFYDQLGILEAPFSFP